MTLIFRYPVPKRSPLVTNKINTKGGRKDVPLQVMVPADVRRQVVMMGAKNDQSIRITILRALAAIGVNIPESEMVDRRGRRNMGR